MKKLKFAKPQKGGQLMIMEKDVRILYCKRKSESKNSDTVVITFNNGIVDLISNTGYITIAVEDNNMYFLGVERKEGWKATKCNGRDNKYKCQITYHNLSDEIKSFIRTSNEMDFELKYSNDYGLYYIGHPKLKFAEKRGPGRPRKN